MLVTRKRDIPGARYFGPYTDVGQLRRTLAIIRRLYTVRSCQDRLPEERRERPCLDFYIGRCRAPCMGWQDWQTTSGMVTDVRRSSWRAGLRMSGSGSGRRCWRPAAGRTSSGPGR